MLARLLGLTGTTFLTALVAGGWFWWSLFALAVLAAGGYVAALRAMRVRRDRTREVVHLHPAQRARAAARRMLQDAARASAERSLAMDDRSRGTAGRARGLDGRREVV